MGHKGMFFGNKDFFKHRKPLISLLQDNQKKNFLIKNFVIRTVWGKGCEYPVTSA